MKPPQGFMQVEDLITLYPDHLDHRPLVFLLHGGFKIESVEIPHQGDWKITQSSPRPETGNRFRVEIATPENMPWPDYVQIRFRYQGVYRDLQPPHPPETDDPHTVVLAEESWFYPVLEIPGPAPLLTFSLETVTPPGWRVVSQGKRVSQTNGEGRIATTWKCDDPMEEIFLITDRYVEYQERMSDLTLRVFLREDDPALAGRYLKAARAYIRFFEKMLGPYPFVKFAVVENSEQTGYGMPSFTLLGSRVLRFPFILHTSYPHEILHNWWGNGVYLDPASGNWSEGLTAYLADHLLSDLADKGAEYRLQELMKYLSYVTPANDFPLTTFTGRSDMVSQAVGYGKWLMVLHMLRQRLGNKIFLEGLHNFYFNNTFQRAGFDVLQKELEDVSGQDLKPFFVQWIERAGAPELHLTRADVKPEGSGFRIEMDLDQKQTGPLYHLAVPIAVWLEDSDTPRLETVTLTKARQTFSFLLTGRPRGVTLDPWHDVFRRLNPDEVPPSIGQTYGANSVRVLISKTDPDTRRNAYTAFAQQLGSASSHSGDTLQEIPPGAVWLLGQHHPAVKELVPWLTQHGVLVSEGGITVEATHFDWKTHSFALTVPHPQDASRSVTWLSVASAQAMPGLIRKLPHYGKYGYLVFEGEDPTNVAKGLWPAAGQSMKKRFDSGAVPLALPPRPPLVPFSPDLP